MSSIQDFIEAERFGGRTGHICNELTDYPFPTDHLPGIAAIFDRLTPAATLLAGRNGEKLRRKVSPLFYIRVRQTPTSRASPLVQKPSGNQCGESRKSALMLPSPVMTNRSIEHFILKLGFRHHCLPWKDGANIPTIATTTVAISSNRNPHPEKMNLSYRSPAVLLMALAFVSSIGTSPAATHAVNPGDDLNAKINSAVAGDTVLVSPGTYNAINLQNRIFSSSNKVVVRKNGTGNVVVRNLTLTTGAYAMYLKNVRYIAFDGLTFQGGITAAAVQSCFGLIFKNCTFTGSGQAGIHVQSSNYIDVIGGTIFNTGNVLSQYGEGVYVGNGSTADNCAFVWIEGVEFYNTGNAEAIDFKPGANRCTARGNNVHDIHPGTSTVNNEGAIVVNGYDYGNFVLTGTQNIWIENNVVNNVSGGTKNRGIVFFGSGVKVKGNTVTNCAKDGIHASNWMNKGYANYLYGNTTSNNNPNVTIQPGITVLTTNPGTNPYNRQTWY